MTLEDTYRERYDAILVPLAARLEAFVKDLCHGVPRIDRITARAKGVGRFVVKAQKQVDGRAKYSDPLNQIQDQIGARIVTFYLPDVDAVARLILDHFRPIEQQHLVPESVNEFGYEGKHFILFLPTDVFDTEIAPEAAPKFFELQIKTLFQHAWSEANHDLAYKPETPLSPAQNRRIAFTAAQAWGADWIFAELWSELSGRKLRD